MALDGIFLHHLKKEISNFAIDSRVDKIHQPSRDELVINLRSREGSKKLLISCNADTARIHFTDYPPENPSTPPMLCLLLRKRLTGARVISIEQIGLDRILRLRFSGTDELGEKTAYSLIAEIMGRHSNIIFLDENDIVIDAFRRVDENVSRVRRILPGEKYMLPPVQNKLNILHSDISEIEEKINSLGASYKAFQSVLEGTSPIVCRELEEGCLTLIGLRYYAENPCPTVVFDGIPKDFSFIPVNQYGTVAQIKEYPSCCALLDYFYYERARSMRVRARSSDLFKKVTVLSERAARKLAARIAELEECRDKEKFRIYGDLITSNQYRLEKGALFYEVEDYYNNNEILRIPANPALTPSQNAQRYYKEYRKKQAAETKLLGFIGEARAEITYFETVFDAMNRSETDAEITEIINELAFGGYIKKKNSRQKAAKPLSPMRFAVRDGFTALVGRNNTMNDRLTLKTARNYDTWFHVQNEAGSHVVCQTSGREITDDAIRDCAMLAAYYSKARSSSNVAVDYTLVKNVKKPNGAKAGMVIYDVYKTEYVTPDFNELDKIERIS